MLQSLDIVVFVVYIVIVLAIALVISLRGQKANQSAEGYFLASKSLPWWAIGASLIASNISAEQFIGMSGSGYAIGLAIASYEWMAAITLLLVGKFLLPIFFNKGIYTMPEYLESRFDVRTRVSMAVFWLLVYVFVNLTSVLYLGALALKTLLDIELGTGVLMLAAFSAAYTVYGGLRAVAWTDVIQIIFLVLGGLIATWQAVSLVGGSEGFIAGFKHMLESYPEKWEMILEKGREGYQYLPGWGVLLGGLWVANISYWGLNQYIIQRALAGRNLPEAQKGMVFAAYLKILMPLIVVVPGIAAFALNAPIKASDEAYPWVLSNVLGTGMRGLAFAALMAAVVSSLSSMTNSTATLFTLDIYKRVLRPKATQKRQVFIGRLVSAAALVVAVIIAPKLATLDQAFQFIQDFTGLISPGVVVIFLLGMFWKKAGRHAAFATVLMTIPVGWVLEQYLFPGMPFLNRMGVSTLLLALIFVVISLFEKRRPESFTVPRWEWFSTGHVFNYGALGVIGIVAALYYFFR